MIGKRFITLAGATVAAGLLLGSQAAGQDTASTGISSEFETLCARISKDPGSATEADIIKVLDLGRTTGKPYGASLAVRKYLAAKTNPGPAILREAIDNAVLVGDFQTAAARCKTYLASARPEGDASEVAAILYGAQLDFLDAADDTYRFMTAVGGKYRGSILARKFDKWYVDQAVRRRDFAGLASRLTMVFRDALPLEQEREYYWEALDWLANEMRSPVPAKLVAASDCRKLATMIRGDEKRKARISFYAANLAFKAGAAGKEDTVLNKEFAAVLTAADAYLTRYLGAETLMDILYVFADGHPDHGWRKNQVVAKQGFFKAAFGKISDEEREELMSWDYRGYIATRAGWAELGSRHASLFKVSPATRNLGFVTSAPTNTHALFKSQAVFLKGVQSQDAAVINSLAAGTQFNECIDHLVKSESWHLEDGIAKTFEIVNHLWQAYSSYPRDEQSKLPPNTYDMAMARFGTEHVARTPLAFNQELVSEVLLYSWRTLEDKSKLAPLLSAYDWVPYGQNGRKRAFSRLYGEFKMWATETRRAAVRTEAHAESLREQLQREKQQLAEATKELAASTTASEFKVKQLTTSKERHDANIKQITTELAETDAEVKKQQAGLAAVSGLENALNGVQNLRGDPDKAPNAYCRMWAHMLAAEDNGQADRFMQAARALYVQVKVPGQNRLPYAQAALSRMMRPQSGMGSKKSVDVFDLQCEILADQLTRWDPEGQNQPVRWVADSIMGSRQGWGWAYIPKGDRSKALRLSGIFAGALEQQLGRGNWKQLFDWMMMTRRGRYWHESDANTALFEKVIKGKMLPVATLMSYIRSPESFGVLAKKYPVETYFDNAWLEEARATGRIDGGYFQQGGKDEKNAIRAHAADVLGSMAVIPRGYGDAKFTFTDYELSGWYRQIVGADAGVRDALIDKLEVHYGKGRFDHAAMGSLHLGYRAEARTTEERKAFFSKLSAFLDRLEKAPARPALPGMRALSHISTEKPLTSEETDVLLRLFSAGCRPGRWHIGYGDHLVTRLQGALVAQGRDKQLAALIPYLWKIARDSDSANLRGALGLFAEQLDKDGKYELATLYCSAGLDFAGTAMEEQTRNLLGVVRSRSITQLGYVIPVERSDPRYALFSAQEDYLSGNVQRSWQSYLTRKEIFIETIRELDPGFVTWVIDMHSQAGAFNEAESYSRALMTLMDKEGSGYSAESRALVILTYADTAFHRLEYPRARALYGKIVAAKEFDATRAQIDARLRMVDVDRITGQFDEAMLSLDEILKNTNRYVQQEGLYHTAKVMFDMEEPVEAMDFLNRVFVLNPNHANARILEGQVNLMLKDYEKARELRHVGQSMDLNIIVPGKSLRVSLSDENLSVVGKSTRIGIRVWTASGDEEILVLTPFAESKTLFEGEIKTELAPIVKGDKILQVLGDDKVHYDFSDKFKSDQDITESVTHTLQVVSDSALYTSSGKILTGEEYEIRALEDAIRARRQEDTESVALSTVRASNQVKPGNRINVRVVDPDRSTSAQKDRLVVKVATTSGDGIVGFPLVETESHSGVFEGAVSTESAPATAFASDSLEGREPNFVISSGKYPAWVGLPDNLRPKLFSVDLNEFATLGSMGVEARDAGRKLKDFILQISPNGKDFETIAAWPMPAEPWDGAPLGVMMAKPVPEGGEPQGSESDSGEQVILDAATIDRVLDDASWSRKRVVRPDAMRTDWDQNLFGKAGELRVGSEAKYLLRFSAAFFQPRRQVRTFKLKCKAKEADYLLLIDGDVGSLMDDEGKEQIAPHDFTDAIMKGVHRVDVYVEARRDSSPGFELLCDIDEKGTLGACPPDAFKPDEHPEISEAVYRAPASVVPNEDASTFMISFGANTRARVLRFIIHDFESDAPAINSLALKAADGRAILPTMSDLMALRENERLEIVPGDRISVSYEDPLCTDKSNRVKESFLSATYANATVSAVFVEGAGDLARYIPLRRFSPGDAVAVMVQDPDLDASDKLDTAAFTIRSALSDSKPFEALETAEHTGTFVGRFFPVEGPPQRASEISVGQEDMALITYFDAENTDPGIGWERQSAVEQAYYVEPELRVYNVTSEPLSDEEMAKEPPGSLAGRSLTATRPEKQGPGDLSRAVLGGSVLVEILWPTIAKSAESKATLYVQTSSGRDARGADLKQPFDVDVWDTITLRRTVSDTAPMAVPVGYSGGKVVGDRFAGLALDDGRFTFAISTTLGEKEDDETLMIKNTNSVSIGFRYLDDKGGTNWLTREVDFFADAFFSIMDRDYLEKVDGCHVGESVYFRVINVAQDATDERDAVVVKLRCAGKEKDLTLTETLSHSGIFQGMCRFSFVTGASGEFEEPNAMPVSAGSTVEAIYDSGTEGTAISHSLEIYKGSDGAVLSFTKRFKDPEMAVRTRLTVAEAYFELAKKHRKMKQVDLSEQEIAEGKRLLEEALNDFPGTDLKAQADYLLANLVLELANETKDATEKAKHFSTAVVQFSDIVANYRTSPYSARAQFKKALALELMGDIDRASDEYVKLAYRWPDNELVAETIARLGKYFFSKGMAFVTESEKVEDAMRREVMKLQSHDPFTTAGEVYSSLAERFPAHKLADKTTAVAGQCFMRAANYEKAANTFDRLLERDGVDKNLMAEALYWCGDCYTREGNLDLKEAYIRFKRLDWDYPASKWAKFARGRLVGDDLSKYDLIQSDE
jgi:tetratricopeptide (TPR) repeat protein